jgi:serine/threonine protein kinase
MTLATGTKLGVYEVISPLGAGGMGEVYRARDTKLQRDVALKILPETMARDAQRMARFEREAHVLASLNHPNIAAIYGLEESNGIRALVMELVEGETLAERISVPAASPPPGGFPKRKAAGEDTGATMGDRRSGVGEGSALPRGPKGLPYDEALPIAKQIAEALEYAHERGVIHRDLKPANVKITPEGTVKVLDFGLAKVLDTQDSTTTMATADSPTQSAMATQAGVILGTAAYMSPEQAKGQRVDRRADIWAFGCVLFEMLTGRKPFDGETISEVFASVIKSEPEWDAIPDATPPSIHRLIRRCLVKDPKQRLRDIGDARIAIEETISGAGDPSGLPREGEILHYVPPQGPRLQRYLPWAVATIFFVLFVILAYFRSRSPSAQPTRSLISAPEEASFAFEGGSGGPVLSPDGTQLVFPATDASGKQALWLRPLDSLTAKRLEGTEGATFPFWAPDSRQLGFFQEARLKKIDVTGGPPVTLCEAPIGRGGAWNKDGVIVFAPENSGGLSSVPAAGGTPTALITPKESGGAHSSRWPVFLPDGRHFLYLSGELDSPGTPRLGIYIGMLGSNEQKFLLQADSGALYSPPGYLLFLRGSTLMAQGFDAAGRTLRGGAFPIAENVPSPQLFRLGVFSVSQTGLLVYAKSLGVIGGHLVWMDANGKELEKLGQPGVLFPRLSPDGKQLAYVEVNPETQNREIWLMDLSRQAQTRFTFESGASLGPIWSPDGARIAYGSSGASLNITDILVKNASGTGKAELLFKSDVPKAPSDWSHDGKHILFVTFDPKTKADIWALPLSGDRKPYPYLQTEFDERDAAFSPDGRWVAYSSDESGNSQVYLSSFPAGGGKWQVSKDGGQEPEWKHDGSALFYIAPGGKLMEASIRERNAAVEVGAPQERFQANMVPGRRAYSVAPDGKRFLVVKSEQDSSPPLTLVTNWTATLKRQ